MQELRTLEIFVKVAERRSFVRAAAELGITQSGVSNAISRLEEQLGSRLLARSTRHVSLTEEGAAYFERCRQALAELHEAELVLKHSQVRPSGNLCVDVPVSFGRLKILPLLGSFQQQYPDVKLRLTFNDRYVDLIEEHVDVAVRIGDLQDSTLIARRLADAQFSVVGSPQYFAKHKPPELPEQLADHNCLGFILRDTGHAREWRFVQSGADIGFAPKGTMSFNDGAAVYEAARGGYGLAQLPDYYMDTAISCGTLVSVLDRFKPKPISIWLVYPHARHLTAKVRAFVDFMSSQFRPLRGDRTNG
jgi:DNA-binding transcriptional LysR family regulator